MYNFPKCNTDMILLRFSKEGMGTEGCRELQYKGNYISLLTGQLYHLKRNLQDCFWVVKDTTWRKHYNY